MGEAWYAANAQRVRNFFRSKSKASTLSHALPG
jgi:hypothetical protein